MGSTQLFPLILFHDFSLASLFSIFFFFVLGVIILGWCTHFTQHAKISAEILVQAGTCYYMRYFFFFFFYFELNCRNHPRFSNLGSSTSFLMVHYFLCLMVSKIREPFWIFWWMVLVLPCWTVRFGPRLKTLLITTHNSLLICDQIEKIFHGESPLRKYKSPWYGPNFFIVRLEPWETMPLNLINWLFWRNSNLHVWLFNNL